MSIQFYQKDGHGYAVVENDNEPVDDDSYPLTETTDFDSYMNFRPSEKPEIRKQL